MRIPIVAGNWKMHKITAEAVDLARRLRILCDGLVGIEVVICPPFTALHAASQELAGSSIRLGAQDSHWENQGALTGEISPVMLKDVGCSYVILGHSERRQHFQETNLHISKKIAGTLAHGLVPIVCIGETLEEREDDRTFSVIEDQVRGCIRGWTRTLSESFVIAYEPVWAIGTGKNATPEQANEVHAFIRYLLDDLFGEAISSATRVLYGGSVNPQNVEALMEQPDVDGALVGGASLEAESFAQIVRSSVRSSDGP